MSDAPDDEELAMTDGDWAWSIAATRIAALEAEVARLQGALVEIARQKKTDELETEYDVECADFEAGYDMCIDRARAALTAEGDG